jgi:hypothetical protein
VRGGRARVAGNEQALRERLSELRGGTRQGGADGAGAKRPDITIEGVDLRFRDTELRGRALDGWGLRAEVRENSPIRAGWDLLRVRSGRLSAELRSGQVALAQAGERRLERVEMAELGLTAELGGDVAEQPAPPAARPQHAAPARSPTSLVELLRAFGPTLARVLGERFEAEVVALRAEVTREDERVRIGPSSVEVERHGNALDVAIVPHPAAASAGTPLTIRARAPFDSAPVEIALGGGPISLSALGVQVGDFGLRGTDQARIQAELKLVLTQAGDVDVTSSGRIDNARLYRPAISSSEITGIELGWRAAGSGKLDGSKLVVRDAEVSTGDVRATLSGELERGEHTRFRLEAALPAVACSSLREAIPEGFAPLLAGVKLDGTFAMNLAVEFDGAKPSRTRTKLDLNNRCRVSAYSPAVSPRRFRGVWMREVKGEGGQPMALESGPGSADWTPYEEISRHLETAVTVSEDGGFFRHRGFDARALESAIRDNLIAGRYLRGASTISMQLAKNLYLASEKTLSRKVQEAVFVMLLEQEFSKHELIELYLNVIEFGPGIYGVKRAARHYFDEEPSELSLAQAMYLSSILPNPDSSKFMPDGTLSPRWAAYLRKLITIAHDRGKISDEERDAGLAEELRFGTPSTVSAAKQTVAGELASDLFGVDDAPSELGRSASVRDRPASVGAE